MRLIDADKLLDENRMHLYYHLPNGDIAIPVIDIEHAQTVEQRNTAIWKGWTKSYFKGMDDDDEPIWGRCTYYICSNCGRRTVVADPFCPGCGASMEKEM